MTDPRSPRSYVARVKFRLCSPPSLHPGVTVVSEGGAEGTPPTPEDKHTWTGTFPPLGGPRTAGSVMLAPLLGASRPGVSVALLVE